MELQEGVLDRWFKLKNCASGEIHIIIDLKRPFGKKYFYENVTGNSKNNSPLKIGKHALSILEDSSQCDTVFVPNKCLT
jgi:hypothetical protein